MFAKRVLLNAPLALTLFFSCAPAESFAANHSKCSPWIKRVLSVGALGGITLAVLPSSTSHQRSSPILAAQRPASSEQSGEQSPVQLLNNLLASNKLSLNKPVSVVQIAQLHWRPAEESRSKEEFVKVMTSVFRSQWAVIEAIRSLKGSSAFDFSIILTRGIPLMQRLPTGSFCKKL